MKTALAVARMSGLALSQTFLREDQTLPDIFLPYSFYAKITPFTLDYNGALVPVSDMEVEQYMDSERNIERFDVMMDIPDVGYGLLQQFMDFNNKVYTMHIPKISYCVQYPIPADLDLKEFVDNIKSAKSGYVEYLGETFPSFDTAHSYYTYFVKSNDMPEMTQYLSQFMYFDRETLQGKWAF